MSRIGTYLGSGVTVRYDFGTTWKKTHLLCSVSFNLFWTDSSANNKKISSRCENTKYYYMLYIYIYIYIKSVLFSLWVYTNKRDLYIGLCIGKNLAIRYVSRYRGCERYIVIHWDYCKQGDNWDISYFRIGYIFRKAVIKSTPLYANLSNK